ncbi:hypothetical protein, partial [Burkholderia sp. SIMBA_051]|uniref:hypothetical protein n=1 Tax=Burkholderia sp. SIMBA_051 TaxID=3085792 RepID=UPI00397BB63F
DRTGILAGERVKDRGPLAGGRSVTNIYDGAPEAIRSSGTLTGEYLGGRRHVADAAHWSQRPVNDDTPRIVLEGATEHNL